LKGVKGEEEQNMLFPTNKTQGILKKTALARSGTTPVMLKRKSEKGNPKSENEVETVHNLVLLRIRETFGLHHSAAPKGWGRKKRVTRKTKQLPVFGQFFPQGGRLKKWRV